MSTIEKTILDATGVKPQKSSEDRQKFLARVHAGVAKITDEDWESLEAVEGAQEWANALVEANNEEAPFPEPPDQEAAADDDDADESEDEEVGEEEEEEVEAPKPTAKKAGAKKVGKPAAAKKVAPDDDAKPSKPAPAKKGISMRRALKMILVKKPKTPVDDLIAALEKKGYSPASRLTINTIRADTRDTMKVLKEAGADIASLEV